MIDLSTFYSYWNSLWVDFLGDDIGLDISISGKTFSFDFIQGTWYLLWVVIIVWLSVLSIHLFVDLWEVRQ